MSNQIKTTLDKALLTHDIAEREAIINLYRTTGLLNRDNAIKKIETIQFSDLELRLATGAKQLMSSSIDLRQASDEVIIYNMQFQIDFLNAKLSKIISEEKENG